MSRTFEHYRDEPTYDELKEREREEYVEWYLNQKKNETDNSSNADDIRRGGISETAEK